MLKTHLYLCVLSNMTPHTMEPNIPTRVIINPIKPIFRYYENKN